MKNIPNWIYIVLGIALLITSKFIFFSKKEDKRSDKSGKSPLSVTVNYCVVQPSALINNVFATGKIGAFNQIEVLPEIAGRITEIYCKEGQAVNKGALLVKLNDAELQAQLLKIKAQQKLAEQKLERLKKLIAIKGISQEEYDMQENDLTTLKADEKYVLAQLAKMNVIAPFNGVVGLKNISEGSFVNTNSSLFSLIQVKPLFVEFSVPEKYGALIKNGQSINFSVDNLTGGKTFSADVYAIEPKVDEATKTIRARAIYKGQASFYPGSYAKVFLNLGEMQNALMLPSQCIIATLKGQKVFVAKNGVANETQVKIGIRTEEKIQILEGLSAGDTIIVNGLMSLKKESKVKLLKQVN